MGQSISTILHVIETTGPGGAETVFSQLACKAQLQGYRSIALIRGPGWVEDQLKRLNVDYFVVDCKGSFNLRYLKALIEIIRNHNVEVIQAHLLGASVYCAVASLITGVKTVSTFHGHVDISPKEKLRALKFLLIGLGSKKVISVTQELAGEVMSSGNRLIKKKTQVIANGIEIEPFLQFGHAARAIATDQRICFGALGNIRKAKNYFLAVDFIGHLREKGFDVHLKIAGDVSKTLGNELREHIDRQGLSNNIELLGFIDNVPEFLASLDIYLMTSSSEGHPLALTQALAAGIPILTTPSGVEEIINDLSEGFIAKNHTVDALYYSFQQLTACQDPQIERITLRGRALVEKEYSLKAMCQKYFDIYES